MPGGIPEKIDPRKIVGNTKNIRKLFDEAETIEELIKSYDGVFNVKGNLNAYNPYKFGKNPIIILGEDHVFPFVPCPRDKSSVLISENFNSCYLGTHNECFLLETDRYDSTTMKEFFDLMHKLYKLAESCDVKARFTLNDLTIQNSNYLYKPLSETTELVSKKLGGKKFSEIPKETLELYNDFTNLKDKYLHKIFSNVPTREADMIENIKHVITLNPEAPVDVVSGNLHVESLFSVLSDMYNDRAVLLLQIANDDGLRELHDEL